MYGGQAPKSCIRQNAFDIPYRHRAGTARNIHFGPALASRPERKVGTMNLTTYVNFPGTCRQALKFYETHLGGKIVRISTYEDIPEPRYIPPGLEIGSILHARIAFGDTVLMVSDGPPERVLPMRSAYLTITVDNSKEAERIYEALTEGGEVFMKLDETFYAHRFAMFRDQFGVNWMLLHEKPMP